MALRSDYLSFFTNFSAAELMQYRKPDGFGPSSNTCPKCAPQRAQRTSVRSIPKELSDLETIFSAATGSQKLGQPVPDSNFVSDLKSAVPQLTQR